LFLQGLVVEIISNGGDSKKKFQIRFTSSDTHESEEKGVLRYDLPI
jgi:hypothetical protein